MVTVHRIAPSLLALSFCAAPLLWWQSLRSEISFAAPDGQHTVRMVGRFGRPLFPLIHSVYAEVYNGSERNAGPHRIHWGDWMDPWFDLWYPRSIWIDSRVLRLTRLQDESLDDYDEIVIRNVASTTVSLLRISCRDMFLLVDLHPGQVVTIEAPMQRTYMERSWLEVDGEFADGGFIGRTAKNFTIPGGTDEKLGARYNVDVTDSGITLILVGPITRYDVPHTVETNMMAPFAPLSPE
jgi:hypothetical protein